VLREYAVAMFATVVIRLLIGLGILVEIGALLVATAITDATHGVATFAWLVVVLMGVPLVWTCVALVRQRIRHIAGRETNL
jgi:hypothetical protein